jgi:hypothetical protein
VFVVVVAAPQCTRLPFCAVLVVAFVGIQLLRLRFCLKHQSVKGLKGKTSLLYGYVYCLSMRRGVIEKTVSSSIKQKGDREEFSPEELKEQEVSCWQKEVVETYRHMREHGNSAFIFFLELVLAAMCYVVVSTDYFSAHRKLAMLGVLFAIWALPAVSVHLLGQTVERRFSIFDRKLKSDINRDRSETDAGAGGGV